MSGLLRFLGRYPKWLVALVGVVLVLDVILIFSGKAGYVLFWAVLILACGGAGRVLGRHAAQRRRAKRDDLRR